MDGAAAPPAAGGKIRITVAQQDGRALSFKVLASADAAELLYRLSKRASSGGAGAATGAGAGAGAGGAGGQRLALVDTVSGVACAALRGGELCEGGCYSVVDAASAEGSAAVERAHAAFLARVLREPSDWQAWGGRSACSLLLGRPHLAAEEGICCQDLAAFEPEGYLCVAEACLAMGSPVEARVHCLNGLAGAPHPGGD